MITDQTAEVIHKVSTGAAGTGAVTAIYYGLTLDQWSIVGIIAGIVIGVLGLLGNLALAWYFKSQHLKLARAAALADAEE